jgi:hypothetical protein
LTSARLNARPVMTELGAWKVAVGATLITITLALYSVTPPSLSLILPLTARVPLSVVGQATVLLGPEAP